MSLILNQKSTVVSDQLVRDNGPTVKQRAHHMIKFEDVTKSYTGKRGCMCGCLGTYRVASHHGVEAANKAAGWEAHSETNDRAVKMAVTKLNKAIDWDDEEMVAKHVEDGYAWFDTDTRTCVVYFS